MHFSAFEIEIIFRAVARKRARMDNDEVMEMDSGDEESGAMTRSKSRNRSQSHVRGPGRDKAGMKVKFQKEICVLYKKDVNNP